MDDESRVVAELEARGLYDPSAADAPERLALLEFLLGLGATVADMEAAVTSWRRWRRRSYSVEQASVSVA